MGAIDPAKLSRLFAAHAPALALYARQWLDADAARDAVQEAFIHLMQERAEPGNVKAWLCRVVRNAALDHRRGQSRRLHREQTVVATRGAEWFEARPEDLIDAATAQEALGRLPEEQREVIVLRIWNGLGLAEIAELVHAPVSTVFSRYRAGLAAVRMDLEKSCKTTHPKTK